MQIESVAEKGSILVTKIQMLLTQHQLRHSFHLELTLERCQSPH